MQQNHKLINVIIDLQTRGFNHDFVIENEYIRCLQYNELISPDDFEILETYHCDDREGGSLVYAIRLSNYDVSGILMSSYRSYIRGMSLRLWSKFNNVIKLNYTAAK
ncbi:hypothetical protein [Mucilaginibacter celer]|uniref:Phosphoribosylpyrophosphate synthetase n=1 Tax=Mucilaginibacter celer TaxID=2305508 RepID=A0A494VJP0_9SPHI|nr:hypothetical protein [Mucilaginibacter celer]AYL94504.1 hypothetical protein HYN43_003950 [Mucilaginibacter celer]